LSSFYSFAVSESTDATYNFSLLQVDAAGNSSPTVSLQWIRASSVPEEPLITMPLVATTYSNLNSFFIEGSCTDGNTVEMSGDATDSVVCSSSAFSFTISKVIDGTYNFSVRQKNLANAYSGSVGATWVRDSIGPSAPTITTPAASPYTSTDTLLTYSGACESGAIVRLSGDADATTSCVAGSYSLSVAKGTDGTYNFNVSQSDLAGNASTSTATQWVRDSIAPGAPTLTSPAANPSVTNGNSVVLQGACESGTTVRVSGDGTGSALCASSAYSITVSKATDASFQFSINQTDSAGNVSPSISFTWIRDTISPSAVVITTPASTPLTSAVSDFIFAGTCEAGTTIHYAGDASGTATCASGSFNFSVNKVVDGTYNFSLSQTDLANNSSPSSSIQWVRISSIPTTPTITFPNPDPYNYYSNADSLTITGGCTSGNTVEISGATSDSTSCSANSYSFSVTKLIDGNNSFVIKQKNGSGIYSSGATFTWVRDTVAPGLPIITIPIANPVSSTGSSLTMTGICEDNATVMVSGDATASAVCSSSSFSITVAKSVDGNYNFSIKQTDRANNTSGAVIQGWIRDTLAPASPTVTIPSANPFISGDSSISIKGACEAAATVTLSGASSQTATCSGTNQYSFAVSQSNDGTYDYTLSQRDSVGNTSANVGFQWIRDTTVPFTPAITSPAADPYVSNASTLSISVTCDTTIAPTPALINLSGDVAASQEQSCTSSPITFVVPKSTDGTYQFAISQENPNNGQVSADETMIWTRDTSIPAAPTITSPSASPYTAPGNLTLAGGCETGTTVNLTGDSTQNKLCSASTYSFTIQKSTDATYNFSLTQTDAAGNTSAAQSQRWIRDTNSVQPPTISSPAANPYLSNSNTLVLSGTCTTGLVITLGGNILASEVSSPASSLTQTCSGGSYSYVINKALDSSYTFSLKQTFNSVDSTSASFVWNRDSVAPTVTLTSNPTSPNLVQSSTFTFNSSETGSTYQCKLDTASYSSCTSPVSYSSISNGSHTFSVKATDTAGNIGAVTSYTWTQASYNTVALYHLNSAFPLTDSGFYTQAAGFNNGLTAVGAPTNNTTGKLPSSSPSSRTLGTGKYYSVADNNSLDLTTSTMTVEGYFNISASPGGSGTYYTLVSKNGTASPNFGWEVLLERSGSSSTKYILSFVGSTTGTLAGTKVSSTTFTLSTGTWNYFAVSWSLGTVRFYTGTSSLSSRGSKTIGTVGVSKLAATAAPMLIGAGPTSGTGNSKWFAGAVDEIRLSQPARPISIVPTGEFIPD
jgi:hypothetical protein